MLTAKIAQEMLYKVLGDLVLIMLIICDVLIYIGRLEKLIFKETFYLNICHHHKVKWQMDYVHRGYNRDIPCKYIYI